MNIVVWGTGNNAEIFYKWLNPNVAIRGVVDGNPDFQGGYFHEHEIKSIEQIDVKEIDFIVICSLAYLDIKAKIQSLDISDQKVIIAVAEYYADCADFEILGLRELLIEEGIKWFTDRIKLLEKKKRYELISHEIIESIENIVFDTDQYPLSCYDFAYSPEVDFISNLFNYVIQKYKLEILHNNCFGYKAIFHACSMEHLLQFDFPADCYPILAFINKYVSNLNCSIDVGANMGFVSLFLSNISKEVHAFEPSKETSEMAIKSIELNGVNNIKWNVCGCGDSEGEEEYYDYGYTSGHNSFVQWKTEDDLKKVSKVPITTLDTYCAKNGIEYIDLLKLDVEGYEPYVIRGCKRLLERKQIGMIFFEVSIACVEDWEEERSMIDILSKSGFEFFNLHYEKMTCEQIMNIKCHQDIVGICRNK